MLKITMFSAADKVKGQGVGSAYLELIGLLKERFGDEFDIKINRYRRSQISHYHTINFPFFLSTFLPGRGRKIGYVHFLPETLEGSIKIPQPFRAIFYWYVLAFYKRMDHIVVVNPSFVSKLEASGISRGKITYIPNFVSKDEFHEFSADKIKDLRAQYHFDQDKFMVLGTGQIQERKGVNDFITLAKQNPSVQFVWAGGFSFGRITDGYAELKKVVDNPPANLRFPGIVDRAELVNYYNMADLFLLPSYNELFPMSVLEAFSCGTPVLLRDLDLYRSIIDGYYEAADDVDDMQNKLIMLKDNPAGMKFLHDKSLIASQRYSEDHLAEIWHRFYLQQAKED
ncbi:glycosyltransferase [Paucilactobacillus hokkaidonensis JCM 18461]|uniref:Glycosyltransferase n=2 Tax=Paucilactobacillus hokkaidonensis TaxID=1193095 RepID=A0A0A1GSK3_9LACO|nr:glycosyltransferase family 4 protein [Paucilactobacillus hokkaidonensis]KRO07932.1 glycosyltransferase [Paucilactobacillus hokkaidonensis]BAP85257.1 glycosyltransferase [Paucilactobacillus hokkaidonensis JCM 18461]